MKFNFWARKTASTLPSTRFKETASDALLDALILQMPDSDITLKKIGMTRAQLRALETDDEITAAIETRREALIAAPWRLEPGKGRAVTALWDELTPHLPNILRSAFNAVLYGYNVQEVVYSKKDNGRIGIQSVVEKPLEWFEPKNDGTLIYRNNYDPVAGVEGIIVDTQLKFLLTVRNPNYRNPYGEALLSRLYWPWYFRTNGWRFWVKNLERTGTPFIKGTAPDRKDENGKNYTDHLSELLDSAAQNAVLSLPEGWTAEFMSAAQTQSSFDQFETAVTKRIQKLILGQTLTSDVGSSGSYAAAKVHDGVRQDRRNADMRLVTNTVQTLVNALHTLNGFSGAPPTFIIEDEQGLNLERAQRDALLVQAGVLTLSEDYLLRTFDFEQGEIALPASNNPAQQPQQQQQPAQFTAGHSCALPGAPFTPEQMQVEKLADSLAANLKQPLSEKDIAAAIMSAKNPEDLEIRLAVVLRDANLSEFTAVLEKALFACDVMGYAHAE